MHPSQVDSIVALVRKALEAGKVKEAVDALVTLHPADQAEAFLDLESQSQETLFATLDSQEKAEILEEMAGSDAAAVANKLPDAELADVLDEMTPEGAADILGDLSKKKAETTLSQMEEAEEVSPLLKFPPDTAGGLMSPEFLALSEELTAQEVIEQLRRDAPHSETPYYLYVVSKQGQLHGVVPLRDLITANPLTELKVIMNTDITSVHALMHQDELSELSRKYNLLLIPVIDDNGILIGVVKSRDIIDVIEERATEDLLRLGGVTETDDTVWTPLARDVRRRLPWLYINLGTAFLAAWVVSLFESTIQQFALLAVFQGIIAGQGGNAATQTITLIVRGLALREVEVSDGFRVLRRELCLGVLNGIAVGLAVGAGAYLWIGNWWLGVVVTLAMIGTMIAAGIAGTVIPLLLKVLRLDPALASGVLVTTVTDCVGFGLFLWLATVMLSRILGVGL